MSDVDLCWGGGEAAVVVVEGILLQKALARTAADHRPGVEEYYKRMVGWGGNPNNPLFLRNYAQFLY